MTELKPCPFCGGEAEVQTSKRWPDGAEAAVDGYTAVCQNLECILGFDDEWWCETEAEAIAAWNTRAEGTCEGIVRCRDCVFFDGGVSTVDTDGNLIKTGNLCGWLELWVEPEGFCVWGEKEE